MRNEHDGSWGAGCPQLLFDLGTVTMAADGIGPEVLVHLREELLHLRTAPCARRPGLGVDDNRVADDAGPRQREEAE